MAAIVCQKGKRLRGLFITAMSGNHSGPICTVGNSSTVKHIVNVENLQGYPADVTCEGSIQSNPRKLKFISTQAGDTAAWWQGTYIGLPDQMTHEFSHATLTRDTPRTSGKEIVNAQVSVSWPQPVRTAQLTVGIDVNA